jgi:hypothetical protein
MIQIVKRKYEVYNCGPEIKDIPTLETEKKILELRDEKVHAGLFCFVDDKT